MQDLLRFLPQAATIKRAPIAPRKVSFHVYIKFAGLMFVIYFFYFSNFLYFFKLIYFLRNSCSISAIWLYMHLCL